MEVAHLSPEDVKAFRDKTRPVYDRWAGEIGIDLVRSAESIVESAKKSPRCPLLALCGHC